MPSSICVASVMPSRRGVDANREGPVILRGRSMKFTTRQRLLASTLLIGAAAMATPAWAQTGTDESAEPPITSEADPNAAVSDPGAPPEADADTQEGESIIVTGSRVPRRDLTSTSPLTVVQDEEFALSGSVNVEQV